MHQKTFRCAEFIFETNQVWGVKIAKKIFNKKDNNWITWITFKRLMPHLFCFRCFSKFWWWFLALLKAEKVLPWSRFWREFHSLKFSFLSSIWIYNLLFSRIAQNSFHCYTLKLYLFLFHLGVKKLLGLLDMVKQTDPNSRIHKLISKLEEENFIELRA